MHSLFKKRADAEPAAPKDPQKGTGDPAAPRSAAMRGLGALFGGSKSSEPKIASPSVKPEKSLIRVDSFGQSRSASGPPSRRSSEKKSDPTGGDTFKSASSLQRETLKKQNSFRNNNGPQLTKQNSYRCKSDSTESMQEGGLKMRPSTKKGDDRTARLRSTTIQQSDGPIASSTVPLKSRRPSIKQNTGVGSADGLLSMSLDVPLRTRPSQLRRLRAQDEASSSSEAAIGFSESITFDKSQGTAEMKALLAKQRQELMNMGIGATSTRAAELKKTAMEYTTGRSMTEEEVAEENVDKSDSLGTDELDVLTKGNEIRFTAERIRQKWRWAFEGVKRSMGFKAHSKEGGLQAIHLMEATKKSIIENPSDRNSNNLSSQLSSMAKPLRADNQKSKLLEILNKPVMYRSAEQLYALNLILKNFPAFARYSRNFRMKIVEKGQLMEYGAFRVIVRQNGSPWHIYFLLSGTCQSETVVVRQDKGLIRRKDIVTGEAFGEFGMLDPKERRSETVYSLTPIVLLAVSRDIYVEMMQAEVMTNKNDKLNILRMIPGMVKATPQILDLVLSAAQIYTYEPNTSLLRAGDRNMITIILEGQCRASRLVPFLVKSQDGARATTATEITNPLIPGTEIPSGEEVVYHNLSIGNLGPGEMFPRLALQRSEGLEYRLQKVEISKVILLMNVILRHTHKNLRLDKTNIGAVLNQSLNELDMDLEDSVAGVDLSVISVEKVTCLVISKMDLVNVLTEEILSDLIHPDAEGLTGIPIEDIQQSYLDKIQWNGYRNQVVKGVIDRRASAVKNR